jgi:glycosyltransferase involved in cell wall biosynthesis
MLKLLAKQCQLKVFYTWGKDGVMAKQDPGFGKTIAWDLPLLEGYDYELLENISKNPGSHHGKGIINPNIINKIEKFSPNAILIYGYIYHSHFKVMRHFKGKTPIWFRGDSTLLDEKTGVKSWLKKSYLKWVYQHIDNALYVGLANKAYFKAFRVKEEQLVFAPHAVDNDRFAMDRNQEASELRQKFNIATTEILILFAGKLETKKNPEFLLRAFIELSMKEAHLLFVGNGHLEKSLKSQVSNLKSQNIHFIDFQNQTQMPVVYQACDLFVLPSQGPGETWGLAVNEAMACGKAILVSDKVGCAADLVQKRINGEIFQANNFADLKRKLLDMINDPIKLMEMGKVSRKLIQDWSFENQAKQILNLLDETH